jgi:hypothetical protein
LVALLAVYVVSFCNFARAAEPKTPNLDSFDAVLDQLNRDSVLHRADVDRQWAVIPTKLDGQDSALWIRWRAQDQVLHFMQLLPMEIANDRMPAMETAISRINFALAVPGVELDHGKRLIAYRLSVPFLGRGGVTAEELRSYMRATHTVAAQLHPPLKQIAEDGADPIIVLELLKQQGFKSNKPAE